MGGVQENAALQMRVPATVNVKLNLSSLVGTFVGTVLPPVCSFSALVAWGRMRAKATSPRLSALCPCALRSCMDVFGLGLRAY